MKILVLGASGMLGHMVTAYFLERGHDVVTTSTDERGVNYYDAYKNVYGIEKIIGEQKPEVVINCIGILNQVAEDNHALASLLNSFLPNYLDELSEENGFKLVHITTDCVFSGERGDYTKDDFPDAETYYGLSKALGEVNNDRTLTLRTSIVGPDQNPKGIGLFQWFTNQSGEVGGYTKVIWTGVTTLQFAKCIEKGLEANLTGLHHAVNGEKISKYELLRLFAKYFNTGIEVVPDDNKKSDKSLVKSSDEFDFQIPSYEEMVKDMHDWVMSHPEMYPELITKVVKK
ncbi:SDR family oxidoreductase [Candidatus Saccharibacteria bacterium]|nr:SDR family oxidoreductase [Candidatus Saccharibacteria bacterium]